MNILSFFAGFGTGLYVAKYDIIDWKKDVITVQQTPTSTTYQLFGINVVTIKK